MDFIHSDKHYVVIGKAYDDWQIAAGFGGGSSASTLLTKEQAIKLRDQLREAYNKPNNPHKFYVAQLTIFIDETG